MIHSSLYSVAENHLQSRGPIFSQCSCPGLKIGFPGSEQVVHQLIPGRAWSHPEPKPWQIR